MKKLFSLVYPYLRRKALFELRNEKAGHTFQATDLVHEAYIRLVGKNMVTAQNRAHFFAICGRSIRQILTDHARSKNAQKRGGDLNIVKIEDLLVEPGIQHSHTILSLNMALERLEEIEPLRAQLAEMRIFASLSLEESANVLNISYATAQRRWRVTKIWLQDFLKTQS